jgi:general secretion pathway protein D
MRFLSVSTRSLMALALCCLCASQAVAEKNGAQVMLNLKEADIATLIATVSEVTGRNFVVDPHVKGKVTVVSSSPMDADAVYATFLSVLAVNGYAAVPSGAAIKIVPDANARSEGGGATGRSGLAGDEMVTCSTSTTARRRSWSPSCGRWWRNPASSPPTPPATA